MCESHFGPCDAAACGRIPPATGVFVSQFASPAPLIRRPVGRLRRQDGIGAAREGELPRDVKQLAGDPTQTRINASSPRGKAYVQPVVVAGRRKSGPVGSHRRAADRHRAGRTRRPAPAGLAGLAGRTVGRIGHRHRGVEIPRRTCARQRGGRSRVRPLAGDVDRGQCAAALQHCRHFRALRCISRLDPQAFAQ